MELDLDGSIPTIDWLAAAEYWFKFPNGNGEEAMWRCLLRWASGQNFVEQ